MKFRELGANLNFVKRASIEAAKRDSSILTVYTARDLGMLVSDIASLVRRHNVNFVGDTPLTRQETIGCSFGALIRATSVTTGASILFIRGAGVDYSSEDRQTIAGHAGQLASGVIDLAVWGWRLHHGSFVRRRHFSRVGKLNLALNVLPPAHKTIVSSRALYRRRHEWLPQVSLAANAVARDLRPVG